MRPRGFVMPSPAWPRRPNAVLDEGAGAFRPGAPQWREAANAQGIVMSEEGLDLLDEAGPQFIDVPDVAVRARMNRDAEKAVVALGLAACLPLLRLDHAEESHRQQASHRHGGIEQHQNIERITVLSERRGNEPEIIGKGTALRQHGFEPECADLFVVGILVAAALRC